jgi:cell division septal protein FtsQ
MTRARGASRPRFRLLPTLLLTLAILAVPTVVYAWGRSSSSFDISGVRVSGTHLVPAKKTLRLLQQAYVGDNLFTVTAADVRGTLKPLAFVRAVTVDRDFPSTLAVGITEYAPAAYALAGSRWYVVDEDGYVICTAADAADQLRRAAKTARHPAASPSASASSAAYGAGEATPTDAATATATGGAGDAATTSDAATGDAVTTAQTLTTTATTDGTAAGGGSDAAGVTARLVAGPPGAALELPRIAVAGRVREGSSAGDSATAEMLQVITALPNSYRRRLAAVEDDGGQITLRFTGGPVVTWGDAQRTLAKTVALRTVLGEYQKASLTCTQIDVSIPDRTLARPVIK